MTRRPPPPDGALQGAPDPVPASAPMPGPGGLPAPDDPELVRLIAGATGRVTALDWQGRRLWLKRPEIRPSLRWRLQKGDPRRAFAHEVAGLRLLAGLGAPVPQMVSAGPDHLILADAGPSLQALLADPATGPGTARRVVLAAARVLGDLHARGLAHGRPYLRDICWDGRAIRLIDFERVRARNSALRRGLDQVLFLASLLAAPGGAAQFDAARATLAATAPAAVTRAVGAWVALLRLLAPAGRLALLSRPGNREIRSYLDLAARWRRPVPGTGAGTSPTGQDGGGGPGGGSD